MKACSTVTNPIQANGDNPNNVVRERIVLSGKKGGVSERKY
jgi:hypothetical protein